MILTNIKSFFIPLIGAIVLTAVIIGGAMYWWMITRESALNIEIDNLESQIQANQTTINNGKMTIKIPLINFGGGLKIGSDISYEEAIEKYPYESGKFIGCGDEIIYVLREIEVTSQPLNAAYKELFSIGHTLGESGLINSIADQAEERTITTETRSTTFKALRFIRAEILDGVAMVYLEGDLLSNECNDPRVQSQIEFTAKQFLNITDVKTYLNGKEFDWKAWMNQKG